jgi:hypothetical protein
LHAALEAADHHAHSHTAGSTATAGLTSTLLAVPAPTPTTATTCGLSERGTGREHEKRDCGHG